MTNPTDKPVLIDAAEQARDTVKALQLAPAGSELERDTIKAAITFAQANATEVAREKYRLEGAEASAKRLLGYLHTKADFADLNEHFALAANLREACEHIGDITPAMVVAAMEASNTESETPDGKS